MINPANNLDSLRKLYGKYIYLYDRGVVYQNWLIVPVNLNNNSYTVACFCPFGTSYSGWCICSELETALGVGKAFVDMQATKLINNQPN